jgi:formylglycine-generating enzyme required for sulfatase activity
MRCEAVGTPELVAVPGGSFLMGSPSGEGYSDEWPQRRVEVAPFRLGRCPVTQAEWAAVMDENRSRFRGDRLPIENVSHALALEYCLRLSGLTGTAYRLPTEAEWEYACRAGTATAYSFGDDPKQLGEHAWYFGNSDDKYHQVGKKKPNPWGLHDMHGNVAEWVLDRYTADGYRWLEGKPTREPLLIPDDIYPRSARGGSWLDDAGRLRSAARRGSDALWMRGDPQMPKSIWYHTDATFVGFRVVRPLRVPAAEEAARYDVDEAQKAALAEYMEYLRGRQ